MGLLLLLQGLLSALHGVTHGAIQTGTAAMWMWTLTGIPILTTTLTANNTNSSSIRTGSRDRENSSRDKENGSRGRQTGRDSGARGNGAREAGSTIPSIAKEPLTVIRGLRRSITGGPGAKQRSPERLTAGVRSRAGRTCPGVGQTSSKDVRMQANGAVRQWIVAVLQPARRTVAAPSAARIAAAVQRVIPAAGDSRVVRACHPAAVAEAAVSAAAAGDHVVEVAVEDPAVAAVEDHAAAVGDHAAVVEAEAADSCR
jgi:hypothetical protein